MWRKRRLIWITVVVAALSIGGGTTWYVLKRPTGPTGPVTALVTRRDLSATVTATGTVKAMVGAEVKVGSRIPGRVDQLAVQVGDRVKAGQTIARLEQDDLQAAVEKARADLAAAEAKLATVRNGARTQELQTAEAALRQAEANRLLALANLDRYRQLYQDGGIALQVVDTAARDHDVCGGSGPVRPASSSVWFGRSTQSRTSSMPRRRCSRPGRRSGSPRPTWGMPTSPPPWAAWWPRSPPSRARR